MAKDSCTGIKNKIVVRAIATIYAILMPILLHADGGVPGAFLRLEVGARPLGLGNASVAIAGDASATYWNPAGLAKLKRIELEVMYGYLSLGRTHSFVAFGIPNRIGSFGVSWISLGITGIEGRVGLGIMPPTVPMQLTFDLEKNARQAVRYHLGAEYWFPEILGIRAGYNTSNIVAGFSIKELIGTYHLQLDYSFSTDRIGGLIHRISLLLWV